MSFCCLCTIGISLLPFVYMTARGAVNLAEFLEKQNEAPYYKVRLDNAVCEPRYFA